MSDSSQCPADALSDFELDEDIGLADSLLGAAQALTRQASDHQFKRLKAYRVAQGHNIASLDLMKAFDTYYERAKDDFANVVNQADAVASSATGGGS